MQAKAWGGLYEGYLDHPFGNCFRSLLIDRIAFGSRSSGSYEFDLGQQLGKSLRSRTPFRLQKIGVTQRFFTLILLPPSATRLSYTPFILPLSAFIIDFFYSQFVLLSPLSIPTSAAQNTLHHLSHGHADCLFRFAVVEKVLLSLVSAHDDVIQNPGSQQPWTPCHAATLQRL